MIFIAIVARLVTNDNQNTVLAIFDPHSLIVKSVFDCCLSGVFMVEWVGLLSLIVVFSNHTRLLL